MIYKMDTMQILECTLMLSKEATSIFNSAMSLHDTFPDCQWQDAISDVAIIKINAHFEALNDILSDINDLKYSLQTILDILSNEYFSLAN